MSDPIEYDDRMSEGDALLWQVESDPQLRSTVASVWTLDAAPDPKRWDAALSDAIAAIPRLRQRVVPDPFGIAPPRWETDPHFDPAYHVRRIRVDGIGALRDLLDLAAPIAMQAFDKDRPLWEFHLVDGLAHGRTGVVMKLHHAVSDGMGMVRMTESLVEPDREPDPHRRARREAIVPTDPQRAPLSDLDHLRDAVVHRAGSAADRAARLGRALGRGMEHLARDPADAAARLRDRVSSLGRLLKPASEPMSPIMTGRSLSCRFDAITLSLEELKRAANRVDGTLNDAFVAAVAGGLRIYHEHHGQPVDELRMNMPINVREGEKGRRAGNQFVPARFLVPIGIADPLERMRAIHELVRSQRDEPALGMVDDVNAMFTRLGTRLATSLAGSMMKALDFVTSNVPGPRRSVFASGAKIEHMFPFGPLAGSAANITLFSYAGTLHLGINTDAAAVADPGVFTDCLARGVAEVLSVS